MCIHTRQYQRRYESLLEYLQSAEKSKQTSVTRVFYPVFVLNFSPLAYLYLLVYLADMVEPIFDYQFRLILIGDSTVGKSSLLKYFTDGKFFEVSHPQRRKSHMTQLRHIS